MCIIGLHACGDLAVTGMKLFLNIPEVSALVMVPCCYHKMALENCISNQLDSETTVGDEICDEDIENIIEESFSNFPLSDALKKMSVGAKFVCRPFLRLASQGSNNSWQDWTEANHQRHAYNVLSRAVIQLYSDQGLFVSLFGFLRILGWCVKIQVVKIRVAIVRKCCDWYTREKQKKFQNRVSSSNCAIGQKFRTFVKIKII